MTKIIPDKFAIMSLDPGGTTGLTCGLLRTDRTEPMLGPVIERAIKKNAIRSTEIRGIPEVQARLIFNEWINFRSFANLEMSIPLPNIHLVVERFDLRTQHAKLETVMVTYGLRTLLLYGPVKDSKGYHTGQISWPYGEVEYQTPSQAKNISGERLRKLGLWVKGSTHRCDSNRHLVVKVDSLL